MTHKPNFSQWTADEMRFYRRTSIEYFLKVNRDGKRKYSSYQINVRLMVRDTEIQHYGFELKRYYYYEYK